MTIENLKGKLCKATHEFYHSDQDDEIVEEGETFFIVNVIVDKDRKDLWWNFKLLTKNGIRESSFSKYWINKNIIVEIPNVD
jgi:hypothetical protein